MSDQENFHEKRRKWREERRKMRDEWRDRCRSRMGNDPHNQEIGQVLLEDYGKNQGWDRDRLLLACAHHTAVHRKYGNPLDCAQRYGAALGIATLQ